MRFDLCMAIGKGPDGDSEWVNGGVREITSGKSLPFFIWTHKGKLESFEVDECWQHGSVEALALDIEEPLRDEDKGGFIMLCAENLPRWMVLGEVRKRLLGLDAAEKSIVVGQLDQAIVDCIPESPRSARP